MPSVVRLPSNVESRFEILYRLGSGGMGSVWKAVDRELSEVVALKVAQRTSLELLLRLKHEFRSRARIRHPNLVDLYELFVDGSECCFTMKLLQGVDPFEWVRGEPPPWNHPTLRQRPTPRRSPSSSRSAGRPDLARLRQLVADVARALTALHDAGLVHRDVKLDNVIVVDGRAVLVDFGLLASEKIADPLAAAAQIAGTPGYMAPEQAKGFPTSGRADVYALGLTAAVLLTGKTPELAASKLLGGGSLEAPEGAADLVELIRNMLAFDPEARPSAREVLRRIDADAAAPAPGVELVGRQNELGRLRDWLRRGPAFSTLLVVGPSGVGKTRLLGEALAELSGALVLRSRCSADELLAYQGLDAINDGLLAHLAARDEELAALSDRDAAVLEPLMPALPRLKQERGPESAARPIVSNTALSSVDAAAAAWSRLIAIVAQRLPVILAVDDAQWLDSDSQQLLRALVRAAPRDVSLLMTSREAAAVTGPLSLTEAEVLELPPLSIEDVRRWMAMVGASDQLSAQHVHQELGGLPVLLEQFLRSGADVLDAPSKGEALLQSRLAELSADSRAIMEVLSAAVEPLSADMILNAAGLHPRHRPLLAELRDGGFVTASSQAAHRFEIHHDVLRQAVRAALHPDDLRRLHRDLARAYTEHSPQQVEALFIHWDRAGDAPRAIPYGLEASKRAHAALAFELAHALLKRVGELGPSAEQSYERQVLLAELHASQGRPLESARHYERAAEQRRSASTGSELDDAPRLGLLAKAGQLYVQHGRPQQGWELLSQVLAAVGVRPPSTMKEAKRRIEWLTVPTLFAPLDAPLRRRIELDPQDALLNEMLFLTAYAFSMSNPTVSEVFRLAARRRLARGGDRASYLRILLWESSLFALLMPRWAQARATKLLAFAKERLGPSPDHLDAGWIATAEMQHANSAADWSRSLEAVERIEYHLSRATGVLAAGNRSIASYYRPRLHVNLGQLVEAAAAHARHREHGTVGHAEFESPRTGVLSWLLLAAGTPEALLAEACAQESRIGPNQGWPSGVMNLAEADALQSRILANLYLQRPEEALQLVEAAWPRVEESSFLEVRSMAAMLHSLRGRSIVAYLAARPAPSGERRRLLRELRRCARGCANEKSDFALGTAHVLLAGHASLSGSPAETERHLRTALAHFDAAKMRMWAAACEHALAQVKAAGPRQHTGWAEQQGVQDTERLFDTCVPLAR